MKILVYTCNIFFVFQWNSTMRSTTSNDEINVKPYWGCCFWMLIICLLVRKIEIWKFGIEPQCTFPVWKCIIRLWICAQSSLCHIRCFGINITPIWHQWMLYVSYMWYYFSPELLIWEFWLLSLSFFRYLSRQDSNDECIPLAEMKHSQPHITLYCDTFVLIEVETVNEMYNRW